MRHLRSTESIVVSAGDLAAFLDVNLRTVQRWVADGMPKTARGKYPLKACVQWSLDRLERRKDLPSSSLDEARVALMQSQRTRCNLEVAALRDSLVQTTSVRIVLAALLKTLEAEMDRLPPRVADAIAAEEDPARIQHILFAACRETRARAAERVRALGEDLAAGAG